MGLSGEMGTKDEDMNKVDFKYMQLDSSCEDIDMNNIIIN